ncbi:hypothetical protein MKO06_08735 [Gramella sp. GC03-9]|uniref:DUF4145 domain-containing protein n=1 Tax=Christiangramia oceanisediminis TaxID=2920386 RepID=A0A9X2I509_9FLAO|nr:hypothetical protein [Gramella oceanisediminis]MCP9199990.1 hypothetical protein [Gramella oceanisediminis]
MNKQDLIKRTDKLIDQGRKVLATKKFVELSGEIVDRGLKDGFRTASLSFIKNLYGDSHIYYKDFESRVKGVGFREIESGINILLAIKDEIDNDWLLAITMMISAEIFSDFLEMGKYLLDQNYKDAAAVMIGSVLEEHLRLICKKNSIDIEFTNNAGDTKAKKADTMNADLAKANVYGVLEQKNVTAWLDLRNRAAHGKYTEYTKEQVEIMYQGVLNFIMTNK